MERLNVLTAHIRRCGRETKALAVAASELIKEQFRERAGWLGN